MDLQFIVERKGHEVLGAFDSLAEAYEHLGDGFEFALLDVDVIDGKSFELAGELMERRIPFAFVSASRPSELPPHLQNVAFIPKPFEEALILRSITRDLALTHH